MSSPRYGYGKPPHPRLYEIINRNRAKYADTLEKFLSFEEYFLEIPRRTDRDQEPFWFNPSMPGLDTVALYSFLCLKESKRFYEVGSGFSTMFARRAILDHDLPTKITSIDPKPRAEIDSICDNNIRSLLEDIDLELFEELERGDILFIDGSHLCFQNSDVTVVFLDILPQLKAGVLVEFHDIFLPYDYPSELSSRESGINEQYLLAVYILAKGNEIDILLPNTFITVDPELKHILDPLWNNPKMKGVQRHGDSFWIEIQ